MTRKEVIECLKDRKVSKVSKVSNKDGLVLDPRQLIFEPERVFIDGHKLPPAPQRVVFAFNKPSGLISAYKSKLGKANIGSFMDKMGENLMHVGRLDKLTTGLLLVTNDGDLCHALTDPSCKIEKKYHLHLEGSFGEIESKIERLATPIVNRRTKIEVTYVAQSVRVISALDTQTHVEVSLTEGKNRQIRRMCAIVHLELLHLHRTSVGSVMLGDLGSGEFRALDPDELSILYSPFGGVDGFERKRAQQLIAAFDSGAFLPDLAIDVKRWRESYLG